MAITTKKDLNLIFTTESGKEYRMTIPDYREGITDAEIQTAAAGIVADNIFQPDGFALAKLSGAKRVDTTTTDVAVE
ncbi:DUF2922 domain-containing protein [Eubacterium sp. AM05-23]|uniref:DUF2922 domain-containing protein n=1 Tax=Eubacterium TaxID=1730 RepID=UPI000E4D5D1D|nr:MULTISPECIES: DUF2922 domain-containing protein [Eubacterium]RHO61390.1 DUF2922 domain-containing protein [Eubacterium sp. AM05-23]